MATEQPRVTVTARVMEMAIKIGNTGRDYLYDLQGTVDNHEIGMRATLGLRTPLFEVGDLVTVTVTRKALMQEGGE